MFYSYTDIDIRVLFTLDGNDKGLRGHSKKICKPRFNTDIRKYIFFSNRIIDRWNSLDQDTVDAPSLNSFKNRPNKCVIRTDINPPFAFDGFSRKFHFPFFCPPGGR